MTTGIRVVGLSSDPPEPLVGASFNLIVELLPRPTTDVTVFLEKQRILASGGGEPALFPTGTTYFQLDPQPILVPAGASTGRSEPISTRKNPIAPAGDPPVRLPEQLLFTATSDPQVFSHGRCIVVPILGIDHRS